MNKQNKAQLKRLQTMKGFLSEHKDKHDSFNDWMSKAKERLDSADAMVTDLENLQQHAEDMEVGCYFQPGFQKL